MSALTAAIRYKLSPQDADRIATQYARFAGSGPGTARENELAAYYRRQYRQKQLGIDNIVHASPAQIAAAHHAGALGEPNQASYLNGISGQGALPALGGGAPPVGTSGGPFGVGSGAKVPPMTGTPLPGAPAAPAQTPAMGSPAGTPPPPAMGAPVSGVAMSPLASAMSFALPPPKSRRPYSLG